MILTVTFEGISKAATVLSVLMKVCTIPHHDRGYLYVVLVLQSCSDPLHILPSSSCLTNATSGGFPDIKSEPHKVSYICMSAIGHILPVSRNVIFFVMSVFLAN